MEYKEIKRIKSNPTLKGMAVVIPDVIYSTANGVELKMQIIKPWANGDDDHARYPLIVFVQGSAWTFPDVYYQLPQLSQFAREGYVVATLTHRNSLEGHPFPAFLEDVKTGIRFLRSNADKYQIDPDRVGIWGTSSGGNTALLVGLTEDDPRYKTKEYEEYSDTVKVVVDCFGPTDMNDIVDKIELIPDDMRSIFEGLRGENTKENIERLMEINPVNHIQDGKSYPPFLILQGDDDELVHYSQSELMYHKLLEAGVETSMICVEGAPHEGSFWSDELLGLIKEFLDKKLKNIEC
ncbi:MAG TPA: alpha/beta hydrolase [Clostridiales bacterium]|nr:alpha/beta hydrolase [Clostridiales bacterium]